MFTIFVLMIVILGLFDLSVFIGRDAKALYIKKVKLKKKNKEIRRGKKRKGDEKS